MNWHTLINILSFAIHGGFAFCAVWYFFKSRDLQKQVDFLIKERKKDNEEHSLDAARYLMGGQRIWLSKEQAKEFWADKVEE